MTRDPEHLDPLEALLREAAAAEQAGVFRATELNAERLLRESSQAPVPLSVSIGRKWIPVAAAIGIAAILWPVMYSREFSNIREEVRLAQHSAVGDGAAGGSDVVLASHISGCVAGPEAGGGQPCHDYDFDADGDIDLADFSRYQLAYAVPGP